jgi:signal transduction histidine kinase
MTVTIPIPTGSATTANAAGGGSKTPGSESGGTGLGLGIAHRTARDHGARLVLATTAPVTRFTSLILQQTRAVASTE